MAGKEAQTSAKDSHPRSASMCCARTLVGLKASLSLLASCSSMVAICVARGLEAWARSEKQHVGESGRSSKHSAQTMHTRTCRQNTVNIHSNNKPGPVSPASCSRCSSLAPPPSRAAPDAAISRKRASQCKASVSLVVKVALQGRGGSEQLQHAWAT